MAVILGRFVKALEVYGGFRPFPVRSKLALLGFYHSADFEGPCSLQGCNHVVFVLDTTRHTPTLYNQPIFSRVTRHLFFLGKLRQDEDYLRVIL